MLAIKFIFNFFITKQKIILNFKMNILITICARGGSKGLPGKNIKPLCGKPLLHYAIEVAKQVPDIARIFVSTDCREYYRTGRGLRNVGA